MAGVTPIRYTKDAARFYNLRFLSAENRARLNIKIEFGPLEDLSPGIRIVRGTGKNATVGWYTLDGRVVTFRYGKARSAAMLARAKKKGRRLK
jgi:hypothetical protein